MKWSKCRKKTIVEKLSKYSLKRKIKATWRFYTLKLTQPSKIDATFAALWIYVSGGVRLKLWFGIVQWIWSTVPCINSRLIFKPHSLTECFKTALNIYTYNCLMSSSFTPVFIEYVNNLLSLNINGIKTFIF